MEHRPDNPELTKRFYGIREVTDLTGINATTLRFWESEFGAWLRPRRTKAGTRQYTAADIETVTAIRFLVREKGLKLQAAREQLAYNRTAVDRRRRALDRLAAVRSTLVSLLAALDTRLRCP